MAGKPYLGSAQRGVLAHLKEVGGRHSAQAVGDALYMQLSAWAKLPRWSQSVTPRHRYLWAFRVLQDLCRKNLLEKETIEVKERPVIVYSLKTDK